MPAVHLRREIYRSAADHAGHHTLADRAKAAGVTQPTIYRLLDGQCRPSNRTIAGMLAAYGLPFEALFSIGEVA